MAEPFLGEIEAFPFNFAPKGWALCAGQLLPINQNQALFSLLGTTFGGNGTINFCAARSARAHRQRIWSGTGPRDLHPRTDGRRGVAHPDPERDAGRRPHPCRRGDEQRHDGRHERAEQCGHSGKRLFQPDGLAGGEYLQFGAADDRHGIACPRPADSRTRTACRSSRSTIASRFRESSRRATERCGRGAIS